MSTTYNFYIRQKDDKKMKIVFTRLYSWSPVGNMLACGEKSIENEYILDKDILLNAVSHLMPIVNFIHRLPEPPDYYDEFGWDELADSDGDFVGLDKQLFKSTDLQYWYICVPWDHEITVRQLLETYRTLLSLISFLDENDDKYYITFEIT